MELANGLEVAQDKLDAEINSFFESAPPLKNSNDVSAKLEEFMKRNSIGSGKFTLCFQRLVSLLFFGFPLAMDYILINEIE